MLSLPSGEKSLCNSSEKLGKSTHESYLVLSNFDLFLWFSAGALHRKLGNFNKILNLWGKSLVLSLSSKKNCFSHQKLWKTRYHSFLVFSNFTWFFFGHLRFERKLFWILENYEILEKPQNCIETGPSA